MAPSPSPPAVPADDERVRLVEGDAVAVLATLEPESIDAVICDPPHGILRADWDRRPSVELWQGVCRVLRPGALLLAMCAAKTYHRAVCDIEDAGFEIYDMIIWGFATGCPWNTAHLKDAHCPIVFARKPGPCRPLNIADCRIPYASDADAKDIHRIDTLRADGNRRPGVYNASLDVSAAAHAPFKPDAGGRYPSNVILLEPALGAWDKFFLVPKARTPDGHPTAKPVELVAWFLKLFTARDALVLDPFAGGGSLGVAALLTGRRALLIERESRFAEMARKNLAAAREGNFGMPKRVDLVTLAADDTPLCGSKNTSENEALRCPPKRATLEPSDRLETRDGMAARLGISTRTLRRRVRDGKIPSIPNGRTVRFDPIAVFGRLKEQGVANDVALLRPKNADLGGPAPDDRSGQGETPPLSAGSWKRSRRAGSGHEDDLGAGGGAEVGRGGPGPAGKEEPSGSRPGPGPGGGDEVARLREAADTARVLLRPSGTSSKGNL
jgi:excisionase family DNA binding protein